jgi:hypothetical protein
MQIGQIKYLSICMMKIILLFIQDSVELVTLTPRLFLIVGVQVLPVQLLILLLFMLLCWILGAMGGMVIR